MLKLHLDAAGRSPYRILCLGAHADDIEIGCGGALLQLLSSLRNAEVHWVVFSSDRARAREARASAAAFLRQARSRNVVVKSFRDSFFPYVGSEIKQIFEGLKKISPDLVFTHQRHDLHQDHRLICELTWNTFRDHLILEYEIPKWDGDLGTPNCFIELSPAVCRDKIKYLLEYFPSQRQKDWFREDTFLSLMRLRGMEARAASRHAEAFYCRKIVLV